MIGSSGWFYVPTSCPRHWQGVRWRGEESCSVAEWSSRLLPHCIRRARGHCRSQLMLSAPAAAVCCPSLQPCCKKQFQCIAHKAETSLECHLLSSAVPSYQRHWPVQPEVTCLMPFAFQASIFPLNVNLPLSSCCLGSREEPHTRCYKCYLDQLWNQEWLCWRNVGLFSGCVLWSVTSTLPLK